MRIEPNIDKLKVCIAKLAETMGMSALPNELAMNLINHVLYDEEYQSIDGKNSWSSLRGGLITETEMRNLIFAHSATKISYFNKMQEPGCDHYDSESITKAFDMALYGREAIILECELNSHNKSLKSDAASLSRTPQAAPLSSNVRRNINYG